MFLVTYYNNDKIGFRILGLVNTTEETIEILRRHGSVDKKHLIKTMKRQGVFVIPSGYIAIDLQMIPNEKYQSLTLPYSFSIDIINELRDIARGHARKIKIKKIME